MAMGTTKSPTCTTATGSSPHSSARSRRAAARRAAELMRRRRTSFQAAAYSSWLAGASMSRILSAISGWSIRFARTISVIPCAFRSSTPARLTEPRCRRLKFVATYSGLWMWLSHASAASRFGEPLTSMSPSIQPT